MFEIKWTPFGSSLENIDFSVGGVLLTSEEIDQKFSDVEISVKLPISSRLKETIKIKNPCSLWKIFDRIRKFYQKKIPKRCLKNENNTGELWEIARKNFENGKRTSYLKVMGDFNPKKFSKTGENVYTLE